jgi:hypothetical protein
MKRDKIVLSGAEQTIITGLGHPIYTVDFIEQWINRYDLVYINAAAALQAIAAKGFYEAIKKMDEAGGRITCKPCSKQEGTNA